MLSQSKYLNTVTPGERFCSPGFPARILFRMAIFAVMILLPVQGISQWKLLNVFPGSDVFQITSIYFLDLPGPPTIGFVGTSDLMNQSSEVWKTTDGGWTWKECPSLQDSMDFFGVYSFTFKDSLTGWLSAPCPGSGPVQCFKTTDCGETWMPLPGTDEGGDECVYYHHATDLLFITGMYGPLVSTDEGASWNYLSANVFLSCAFSSDSIGVFSGFDIGTSNSYTTDGGRTWTSISAALATYHPVAIKGTGTFFMMAAGQGLCRSDDSGKTWRVIPTPPIVAATNTLYGDLGHLYTHGHDAVYVSTDTGLSWQSLCGPGGNTPPGFYQRGNYMYADDAFGMGRELWLDTTGIGTLIMSVYLKSNSISARSGDTIEIPVYLSGQSWTLYGNTTLTLPFLLDTNMLTPIGFAPIMPGILLDSLSISHDTILATLQDSTFTLDSENVIGYLRCIVYLSDTLQSSVTLASPQITSADPNCLSLSSTSDSVNIAIAYSCGDSLILAAMNDSLPFYIESIQPNPASSSIEINLSSSASVTYTLFDALGRSILSGSTSEQKIDMNVSSVSSGIYYLRVSSNGYVQSRSISIAR